MARRGAAGLEQPAVRRARRPRLRLSIHGTAASGICAAGVSGWVGLCATCTGVWPGKAGLRGQIRWRLLTSLLTEQRKVSIDYMLFPAVPPFDGTGTSELTRRQNAPARHHAGPWRSIRGAMRFRLRRRTLIASWRHRPGPPADRPQTGMSVDGVTAKRPCTPALPPARRGGWPEMTNSERQIDDRTAPRHWPGSPLAGVASVSSPETS